ncbi:MAG TPA: hypothetical protein ENJ35_04235 [Gammaproteobacteria bacterium]|nr:hypothetical protein [Gammaproteobacteria bacterium]
MPLPRAVQEIGDAAEASAVKLGIKPGNPPVDENGNPAAPVTSAQPAATVTAIDPDERYKKLEERFKKYKAQNDQVVFDLRQENSGLRQSVDTLTAQVEKLNANPAPATPAAPVIDTDTGFKAYYEKLPQSIKDEYTEAYLKDMYIIQQTGAPTAPATQPENIANLEERINRAEQFQEKTRAQLYEEAMDNAFPNNAWITMTDKTSESWNDFCGHTVSPADQRAYGAIIKQGSDEHNAQVVIWVLKQYQQYLSELDSGAGGAPEVNPLELHLTPEGDGGSPDPVQELSAQSQTFTVSQVTQFYIDVATGNKYTPERAAEIEKQILTAQSVGKIIEG